MQVTSACMDYAKSGPLLLERCSQFPPSSDTILDYYFFFLIWIIFLFLKLYVIKKKTTKTKKQWKKFWASPSPSSLNDRRSPSLLTDILSLVIFCQHRTLQMDSVGQDLFIFWHFRRFLSVEQQKAEFIKKKKKR